MEQEGGGIRGWYAAHRSPVDALLNVLLCVTAAALGFSGMWTVFSLLPADLSPWWSLATALPACALMLCKRRAPMLSLALAAALFAIDLATFGGLGPFVVLLDVLWTAVFLASPTVRRRLLVALLAGVGVLFTVALVRSPHAPEAAFLIAVQFAAFVGTDYWWAVAVSQAHELADLHRQRAEATASAAERDRAEAVARERETMARELHDVVAGHVLAMAIRAEAALSAPVDGERDREALRAVRDAGLDAHTALRSMITVLRRGGDELAPTPRMADIAGLIDDARRAGLRVRIVTDDLPVVHGGLEQAVVRVVREALANCLRHASGAEVDVAMEGDDDVVRVRVDSRGGRVLARTRDGGGGWGLSMLSERVDALGGVFTAGPTVEGWSVTAVLPRGGEA